MIQSLFVESVASLSLSQMEICGDGSRSAFAGRENGEQARSANFVKSLKISRLWQ